MKGHPSCSFRHTAAGTQPPPSSMDMSQNPFQTQIHSPKPPAEEPSGALSMDACLIELWVRPCRSLREIPKHRSRNVVVSVRSDGSGPIAHDEVVPTAIGLLKHATVHPCHGLVGHTVCQDLGVTAEHFYNLVSSGHRVRSRPCHVESLPEVEVGAPSRKIDSPCPDALGGRRVRAMVVNRRVISEFIHDPSAGLTTLSPLRAGLQPVEYRGVGRLL